MKALMKKDLYQLVSQFKIIAVIMIIFACIPNGRFVPFAVVYSVIMITVSLQNLDEVSRWDSLALMLPYSRRALVAEKYVMGWLSLAVTLALCTAFQALWDFLGISESLSLGPDYLALLCVYVAIALVFQAVTSPVTFRFGITKGRIINLIFIGVCAGIVGAVATVANTEKAFETVLSLTRHLHIATYPLLAAALCVASIPLSVRGYVKRVEK